MTQVEFIRLAHLRCPNGRISETMRRWCGARSTLAEIFDHSLT
jgi:hypothetical protein